MKTLPLLFASLIVSCGLTAQRTIPADLTSPPPIDLPAPSLSKFVADTIFPAILLDTCFTNPGNGLRGYFDEGETYEGFITGSNTYSDYEKLQLLTYDRSETYTINEVITGLYQSKAETIEEGYLLALIYDKLDGAGNLGVPLGLSDTLFLDDITFEDFVSFTFSEPVEMTTDSFFVSIDFRGVYADLADTTGYVGIASTKIDCGSGENVLEIFPFGDELYFDTFRENWGLDLELFVLAVIDTDVTSTRQPLADYGATVFPNPVGDVATVRLSAKSSGKYLATLTDLNGRQLRRSVPEWVGGQQQVDWQVSDLATGMYLYHIDGPEGRQSGKLMVR